MTFPNQGDAHEAILGAIVEVQEWAEDFKAVWYKDQAEIVIALFRVAIPDDVWAELIKKKPEAALIDELVRNMRK